MAAGVGRVVYAVGDPDPRVDGRGAARLAAAGIAVERGVAAAEATALNAGFLRRVAGGRPWVRAKVGASLDGRTALPDGRSQWVTGTAARADVQRLRAEAGAVVTGIGTVLADDCRLTVRDPAAIAALRGRVPLRVVIDPQARLPATARFRDGEAPSLWLTAEASGADPGRERLERLAVGAGRPSPDAVLALLAARGINDVLLEAGPTLTGAWLRAGVVDELVVYLAPRLLGDLARPLARLPAPASLDGPPAWRLLEAVPVGDDLRVTWAAAG